MTVVGLQELRAFLLLQDVPLISLANIFQNARLWEDALTVARMAVEIAPHFVVNHFTLANVYIAMVSHRSGAKLPEITVTFKNLLLYLHIYIIACLVSSPMRTPCSWPFTIMARICQVLPCHLYHHVIVQNWKDVP